MENGYIRTSWHLIIYNFSSRSTTETINIMRRRFKFTIISFLIGPIWVILFRPSPAQCIVYLYRWCKWRQLIEPKWSSTRPKHASLFIFQMQWIFLIVFRCDSSSFSFPFTFCTGILIGGCSWARKLVISSARTELLFSGILVGHGS
jgi:hypothetical protein